MEKKKIVIRSQSELSNTLNRLLVKGINLPPVVGNEKGHLMTATGYGLLQKQKGGEGKATRYKVDLEVLSVMVRVDIAYVGEQSKQTEQLNVPDSDDDNLLEYYSSHAELDEDDAYNILK